MLRKPRPASPPTKGTAPLSATNRLSVCVLGLGYVGLPVALVLADRGFRVTGVDIDRARLERLGRAQIEAHEDGLQTLFDRAMSSGRLALSPTPAPADVFLIAVPTPLVDDSQPKADLTFVEAAARSVAPHLRPGNLVILESTVPPGATEHTLIPELERSGLQAGGDLMVAHVPERVFPGRILAELTGNARVIGGLDRLSALAAHRIYRTFVTGEITLTDLRTAEMAKLMENTFRDVNIALANEFALLAEDLGVDVWEAIRIANQHPRVSILQPGPGVGGHCIPIDPWFLIHAASCPAPLICAARRVNNAMPHRVARMLRTILADIDAPVVALLGLAYKADTDDTRGSPARRVAEILLSRRCQTRICDPHVRSQPALGKVLASPLEAAHGADCLVLLTDHKLFRDLDPADVGPLMRRRLLVDTRNALDAEAWRHSGFQVCRLGTPIAAQTPAPSREKVPA
jgi:UDP-N-acetyl-D-mannosaminuronic acid dehydrogenase